MPNFTKGRWFVCDDKKIYAVSDDSGVVCIAGLCGDDVSERCANGVLMANAPKMHEALKAILKEFFASTDPRLSGLREAILDAELLLKRLEISSNV